MECPLVNGELFILFKIDICEMYNVHCTYYLFFKHKNLTEISNLLLNYFTILSTNYVNFLVTLILSISIKLSNFYNLKCLDIY